ncbi:spondin domain-containing protein [Chryseobacterium sp. ISL-6]|uniref:spondin domain-containing protein n=1 Tax=Chryseobacterium sp. ISL-6 TaxID=2819143 RepID=UPI001BEB880B|nr:spondin domain-containing protein [Chryseobacterium sp. ISL-6]MBT2620145.1 spondin domain-containing protein [Chryseobacterium sp. ISL-6]
MNKLKSSWLVLAAIPFFLLSCDDNDDNPMETGMPSTITIENVLDSKPLVESGVFQHNGASPVIMPGESTSFQFSAAKGQAISFATMYGWSNDLFFAPENPGIKLYQDNGTPIEGDVSSQIKLWDNGTRINQTPGSTVMHPGTAETTAQNITEVSGTDAQGHTYAAASSLMKVNLHYEGNSMFKSLENNVYDQVVLYPIYDYQLSNFVSFYIQPFTISEKQYIIYYYKLNGEGTYYIKDNAKNKIVFESKALTSNAPISKFETIDNTHILLVEDMGDHGQRAFVVSTENNQWKTMNAFKGRSFKLNSVDYDEKSDGSLRKYLRFANNKRIKANYPSRYFKNFEIGFDTKTQTIFYKKLNNGPEDSKKIESKWENKMFTIDDYYVGENLNDQPMPIPH